MNREKLELWLTDLETTDAPQTLHALQDDGGFCCLGRLCEVAIEDGVDVRVESRVNGRVSYDGALDTPPASVTAWLSADECFINHCISLNDEHRMTFAQIAASIREDYPND